MSAASWMPWIMTQRWAHLLYLHYRVDAASLRPMLPPELEIDTFEGSAWVSLIPLRMAHVHVRDVIPIPTTKNFPELNLRTYVHRQGVQGVWFLSLDAMSRLSVLIAHRAFSLPYFEANMSFSTAGDGFRFTSSREGAPSVEFRAEYRPVGTLAPAAPGTVDAFLAERYCMYSIAKRGHLLRGDISHGPWPIQQVEAEIESNTMLTAAGLTVLDDKPLMAYSPGTHAVAWPMCAASSAQRVPQPMSQFAG